MKKVVIVFSLIFLISLSFVSAGFFGDLFNPTGKVIAGGECELGANECSSGYECVDVDVSNDPDNYFGRCFQVEDGISCTFENPKASDGSGILSSSYYYGNDYTLYAGKYCEVVKGCTGFDSSSVVIVDDNTKACRCDEYWGCPYGGTGGGPSCVPNVGTYYQWERVGSVTCTGCPSTACEVGVEESSCDNEGNCVLYERDRVSYNGKDYSINFISSSEVKLEVDGEITNYLAELETFKLSDGAYIKIKDIISYSYITNKINFVVFEIDDAVDKTCTDTDGGKDYGVRGNVNVGDFAFEDVCDKSGGGLSEYFCDETTSSGWNWMSVVCSKGCVNGACIDDLAEAPECIDEDGDDIYIKGKARIVTGVAQLDRCISSDYVSEALCKDVLKVGEWGFTSETRFCSNGCVDGACIKETNPNCADTDGGLNYFIKGIVSHETGSMADVCISEGSAIQEVFCKDSPEFGSSLGIALRTCANGCVDGACVSETPICNDNLCSDKEYYCPNDCGWFWAHRADTTTIEYEDVIYDVEVGVGCPQNVELSFSYEGNKDTFFVSQEDQETGKIYTLDNNQKFSINGLPCSVDVVNIGFIKSPVQKSVTFNKNLNHYIFAEYSSSEFYLMRVLNFKGDYDGSRNTADFEYYKDGSWQTNRYGAKEGTIIYLGNMEIEVGKISEDDETVVLKIARVSDFDDSYLSGELSLVGNNIFDSCSERACSEGEVRCYDGDCVRAGKQECSVNANCYAGEECVDGECVKPTEESCDFGCFADDKCYPIGYRKGAKYCSPEEEFIGQLGGEKDCNNSFECRSNLCIDSSCVSGSTWQKIIAWFNRLFS